MLDDTVSCLHHTLYFACTKKKKSDTGLGWIETPMLCSLHYVLRFHFFFPLYTYHIVHTEAIAGLHRRSNRMPGSSVSWKGARKVKGNVYWEDIGLIMTSGQCPEMRSCSLNSSMHNTLSWDWLSLSGLNKGQGGLLRLENIKLFSPKMEITERNVGRSKNVKQEALRLAYVR